MVTLVIYSRHARERMIERGISANEVEDAIRKGSKKTTKNKIFHHYRHFTAVTIKLEREYLVITVMPRRE